VAQCHPRAFSAGKVGIGVPSGERQGVFLIIGEHHGRSRTGSRNAGQSHAAAELEHRAPRQRFLFKTHAGQGKRGCPEFSPIGQTLVDGERFGSDRLEQCIGIADGEHAECVVTQGNIVYDRIKPIREIRRKPRRNS
jgi:hypothetical protein